MSGLQKLEKAQPGRGPLGNAVEHTVQGVTRLNQVGIGCC